MTKPSKKEEKKRRKQDFIENLESQKTKFEEFYSSLLSSAKNIDSIKLLISFFEKNKGYKLPTRHLDEKSVKLLRDVKSIRYDLHKIHIAYHLNSKLSSELKSILPYLQRPEFAYVTRHTKPELINELFFLIKDLVKHLNLIYLEEEDYEMAFNSYQEYYKAYHNILELRKDQSCNLTYCDLVSKIHKLHEKPLKAKLDQIKSFSEYRDAIKSFNKYYTLQNFNQAFNYFVKAARYKKGMNENHLDNEIEKELERKVSIVIVTLTKLIKETIINLATRFARIEVREISEKCKIDDENFIIEVAKHMIENKEIYAEYFSSSKSIAFDQQANINEIDKLMEKYRVWESQEKEKI